MVGMGWLEPGKTAGFLKITSWKGIISEQKLHVVGFHVISISGVYIKAQFLICVSVVYLKKKH